MLPPNGYFFHSILPGATFGLVWRFQTSVTFSPQASHLRQIPRLLNHVRNVVSLHIPSWLMQNIPAFRQPCQIYSSSSWEELGNKSLSHPVRDWFRIAHSCPNQHWKNTSSFQYSGKAFIEGTWEAQVSPSLCEASLHKPGRLLSVIILCKHKQKHYRLPKNTKRGLHSTALCSLAITMG